jgi:stalled ribosome rescue protein Dom34
MTSGVAPHPRFAGALVGGGERNYENRFEHQLAHFYDQVIDQLGRPDAIVIFGPGEAKGQLEQRLARHKTLPSAAVVIDAMDTMTEPQIVARVKQHFGLER